MKNVFRVCLTLALLLVWGQAIAQQGVPGTLTQQSPTQLTATTNFATSASTGATITISPPSGYFVYITAIEIQNCAGTTVTAAGPLSVTTTGIGGGTTPVWTIGTTGTAGMCNPAVTSSYPSPIKSNAAGTNVTFILPTFTPQQTIRVNVYYYTAP